MACVVCGVFDVAGVSVVCGLLLPASVGVGVAVTTTTGFVGAATDVTVSIIEEIIFVVGSAAVVVL